MSPSRMITRSHRHPVSWSYPRLSIICDVALVAVLDKPRDFAGRAAHEWSGQVFRDETGSELGPADVEVLAVRGVRQPALDELGDRLLPVADPPAVRQRL